MKYWRSEKIDFRNYIATAISSTNDTLKWKIEKTIEIHNISTETTLPSVELLSSTWVLSFFATTFCADSCARILFNSIMPTAAYVRCCRCRRKFVSEWNGKDAAFPFHRNIIIISLRTYRIQGINAFDMPDRSSMYVWVDQWTGGKWETASPCQFWHFCSVCSPFHADTQWLGSLLSYWGYEHWEKMKANDGNYFPFQHLLPLLHLHYLTATTKSVCVSNDLTKNGKVSTDDAKNLFLNWFIIFNLIVENGRVSLSKLKSEMRNETWRPSQWILIWYNRKRKSD